MNPQSVADLTDQVLSGRFGRHGVEVSVAFLTQQGVRHARRARSYRNHVLSLRVEDAVGSCAVESGPVESGAGESGAGESGPMESGTVESDTVSEEVVLGCVGAPVAELLRSPLLPVRVAALDAYLQWLRPHRRHAEEVLIGRGNSLQKSLHRAKSVVDLLPVEAGRRVLVIGVVNSLLHHLRERGNSYIACDYKGGETEWGEPVTTDAVAALADCDAVLASGMVVGNDTFQPLLDHARATGKPLVMFAQSASGILPHFLGRGVTAISAEPYPFFWLDGGPSAIYRYHPEAR
ncbi:Rossmann-like domain-containing protein [Saccharopolyspora sp. 5N708]|uniref:Rossmann-like domain-containing protein n=1 Tax=Saccharopolyspora sp. 5N708 TaxID=3457424 RepID=UPI003FCFF5BF